MPRRSRTISLTRAVVTPIAFASALLESPSGAMNSSRRISPGWMGASFRVLCEPLMIVDDFHVFRIGARPAETDAELVVDPDAVLAVTVAFQFFQTVSGWNAQKAQVGSRVQQFEHSLCELLDRPEAPSWRT